MKDWEWFALGLIPFAGMPVHLLRYEREGHVPGAGQLTAGVVGSQGLAYGFQRATGMRVADHLAYYRLRSLGFQLSKSQMASPTGPIWRMPFMARMSLPIFAVLLIGTVANMLSTAPGHRRHAYAHERQARMYGVTPDQVI